MIIYEWTRFDTSDPNKIIWMKHTPTDHGLITRHPDLGPPYQSPIELSARRMSVIIKETDKPTHAQILSISYETGWDSFDEPAEYFNTFLAGEFVLLMEVQDLTVPWDGTGQQLLQIQGLL